MTQAEATSAAQMLVAFRQLAGNSAWRELIAPRLREAHERHLLGICDRSAPAEQRAQHLEAYHLARELEGLVPEKIAALERQLGDWVKSQEVVDSRLLDALG